MKAQIVRRALKNSEIMLQYRKVAYLTKK